MRGDSGKMINLARKLTQMDWKKVEEDAIQFIASQCL